MADKEFDLVIIGGGPGGYVAAIRAVQLGMRTACVEKRGALGGTCLNVGCIPSKFLLHSSHLYAEASGRFGELGIQVDGVKLDLETMMARKGKVVEGLTRGVESLFKKHDIEYVRGTGRVAEPGKVAVDPGEGEERTLTTEYIVIATGSEPEPLAGAEVDEERIVTSTGALALSSVPERMVVIGAGVVGLELGSVWSRLGADVTVLEYLDHILPGMDREIGKQAQRILKKQGLDFHLSVKVTGAQKKKAGAAVTYQPRDGGESQSIETDVVLVSVGRRPFTAGLGLDALGVEMDDKGFIRVDDDFASTVPGIYAIGDCVPGPMLAHKAQEDGIACVETLAGQAGHVDYGRVPSVVYTWPEIAGVGKTEEQLKEEGVAYRVGKFPFQANSRGRTTGDTDGLVKILADESSDRVLGVHIIGPIAGDLIMEAVIAMEFGASAEDIARTCHHHPGMGEAVKEAALAVHERPIHI